MAAYKGSITTTRVPKSYKVDDGVVIPVYVDDEENQNQDTSIAEKRGPISTKIDAEYLEQIGKSDSRIGYTEDGKATINIEFKGNTVQGGSSNNGGNSGGNNGNNDGGLNWEESNSWPTLHEDASTNTSTGDINELGWQDPDSWPTLH